MDGGIHNVGILQSEENIIQQFTGLKDKNNKEIYEGDIVKVSNTNTNIEVGGRDGIFRVDYYNGSFWVGGINHMSAFILRGQIFEVIGNAFESPELLKT